MIALSPLSVGQLSFVFVIQLHHADNRNTIKVYIEKNNSQLELIRDNVKFVLLYSRLLLRSDGFNAISPTDGPLKSSPVMLAYSPDGSRCSCRACQNVSNQNQIGNCHF